MPIAFKPPTSGEWCVGADYQQYLTSEHPGNFVAFDVVERKVRWRAVSPAPFWAGAVATSTGLVFTGDMRGYFMALDARSGSLLWKFQTGSGIIGSPITYELDGNGPSHDVAVVDVATLRVTARIPVGQTPWGLALGPSPLPATQRSRPGS